MEQVESAMSAVLTKVAVMLSDGTWINTLVLIGICFERYLLFILII